MLPGSQMPQSACRAQTLQERTNQARLKPLYSQQRLEKRAKGIKIMQPVLHEQGLLPTSQMTRHLKASNQGVKSGLQALIFLLRSPGYHALAGSLVHVT